MSEELAVQVLNQYPRHQYNVLAPATVTQVSPWHRVIVSEVKVDPDPSHGEVYRQRNGELSLHKETLLRLADAAGIRFPTPPSFERDPSDGSYDCTVAAEKQDPDGTWRRFFGSYRWDVTLRLGAIVNPDSKNGQAEARMITTFAMQRAETGAISRVVRKIIQLRQSYAPKELEKPFIVARINFDPWNDPAIREAYRQALSVRLAENVALMRGDFDPDDPLALDGGHVSSRPTPQQLAAATETLQLLEGERAGHEEGEGGNGDEGFDTPPEEETREPPPLEDEEESPPPEQEPPPEAQAVEVPRGGNTPEVIRRTCRYHAKWTKGQDPDWADAYRPDPPPSDPIPDDLLRNVAAALNNAIGKGTTKQRDDKRHAVYRYLFNVDSGAKLTMKEGQAILRWIALPDAQKIGEIKAMAPAEVQAVVKAAELAAGQQEMNLGV